MRVRRLGDMRVRRFRDSGVVLRILMVELKAVAIAVLSQWRSDLSMPESVGDLGAVERATTP